MYGRRGPPKSTPANCKVAPQDRPYKARPSRSQQFRNPKLAPKLHEDTFNAAEIKKGVADEELAKREAERAKKRRRRSESDGGSSSGSESDDSVARRRRAKGKYSSSSDKRRRSPSYSDSGSASRSVSRSVSPASPRRALPPASRKEAKTSSYARGRSASVDSRSRSRSRSVSSYSSSGASRSPSPPPRRERERDRERDRPRPHDDRMKSSDFFGKEDTKSARDGKKAAGRDSHDRRRPQHDSRSPAREVEDRRPYRQRDDDRGGGPSSRGDQDNRGRRDGRDKREHRGNDGRERSLSPFSQRLALTKEMQSGR
ncbi:hypothetical protein SEUCBS139899_008863 [Sporothrix eucalyptigena]|uniref:Uncharacterized protein n=1 Tax=Sporothrix eucalyptigena TaxID=1812306 RepID=A0ABP0ART4_9PEZI